LEKKTMKIIRLKDAGLDVCATPRPNRYFWTRLVAMWPGERQGLETGRILKDIADRHEGPLARKIAREFKERS
jgi:hypothetical protein